MIHNAPQSIKPIALAKVYEVAQVVTIPVIGLGGIMNHEDVVEFLLAGATAIQVGTATFVHPRTAEQIIDDLWQYCQINCIYKIQELVGGLKKS